METRRPPALAALLDGRDAGCREEAWHAFLEEYSELVLDAVRAFGRDYDGRMDRYGFVLESLRRDEYRRLQSYRPQKGATFRGWLAIVTRRLCLDFERSRYGRGGRAGDLDASARERSARRRLVDLAGVALDPELLPQATERNPEQHLREVELKEGLDRVMDSLAPRDRLLLTLRFEDELSVRQIADLMSFPSVFHVYRRLRSVLEEVRRGLSERGIGDPAP